MTRSTLPIRPYHRKYLECANEENPNNARVPKSKNKGYLECLERGWIEEKITPDGGYAYFALTKAGESALHERQAPKAVRRSRRLKTLPPLVPVLPPRLKTLD